MALSRMLPVEPAKNTFIGVLCGRQPKCRAKSYAAVWTLPGTLPPAASCRASFLELCR